MEHEAVKLVLWPHGTTEIKGQTVYKYVVLGMVATSAPIDWPNESVVLQEYDNTQLTDFLNSMKRQTLDYHLGDANCALLTVAEMIPEN
jgi:hypothetical protein